MKLMGKLVGITAMVAITLSMLPLTVVGHADPVQTSQRAMQGQSRALSKPYIVYGAGAVQRTQVAQTLGINKNYKKLVTTGHDARYIGIQNANDADMISSVTVAPAASGAGTLVNLENFEGKNNIQRVTAQQYAMAATMAGVQDVIITVTSEKPVSGDAALAGVYKALVADGIPVNPANANAANHLMEVTNSIAVPDIKTSNKVTAAVTSTASELAKRRQDKQHIDYDVIINQLSVNLQQRGVANYVSGDVLNQLTDALKQINDAPISKSQSFVKQTAALTDKIAKTNGNTMAKAQDFKNAQDAHNASNWFDENIWQPSQRHFEAFENWVMSWFK